MMSAWWLAALMTLLLQIPRPSSAEEAARELHAAYRSIRESESSGLTTLAEQLERAGDAEPARSVRVRLPRPLPSDGPNRFSPLPDVVPPRGPAGQKTPADTRAEGILLKSATGLFDLAQRAARATPPRHALAGECLRAVVERQPDHAEARRLLGYVPYNGGWAKPFAVEQFRKGFIDHPVFGWVKADWQPHLERGELPSSANARSGALALGRRGRSAPSRMEAALADSHRALPDPDQRAAGGSHRLRAPARGVSRPVHGDHGRCTGRQLADRAPLPRPAPHRRAGVEAAHGLLLRLQGRVPRIT